MKRAVASGRELEIKLICLKFLKTTDSLLRQADQLRERRNEFLQTLETKTSASDAAVQEVSRA